VLTNPVIEEFTYRIEEERTRLAMPLRRAFKSQP
jgi:hypothetical protein